MYALFSNTKQTLEKSLKQTSSLKSHHTSRSIASDMDVASEQIIASFQARQATSAYQDMLVSSHDSVFWLLFMSFHQRQRDQLPIARYRNEITSILETSQILVLSGETGWSDISCSSISSTYEYAIQREVDTGTGVHS